VISQNIDVSVGVLDLNSGPVDKPAYFDSFIQ
jgi:hypothetical protein